ncbi:hypothetical protein SKAU_G00200360 [Synaphobranchus kaupii]|uniref:Uncharacterized protein n=1 Tax=Synaphobranchus kaupii TaxID=118154 RepID=A0A9Q1FFN3_SYNKA|nr:hypothetical protein SKAU_G00200360 [Synaphobranchus kaupii]
MAVNSRADWGFANKSATGFEHQQGWTTSPEMGAVDRVDMISSFVECDRKSTKRYKKLFFRLLDTEVLNSYIPYQQRSLVKEPGASSVLLNWRVTLC